MSRLGILLGILALAGCGGEVGPDSSCAPNPCTAETVAQQCAWGNATEHGDCICTVTPGYHGGRYYHWECYVNTP